MVKRDHIKFFLALFFIVVSFSSAHSQNRKYFIITGKLISNCDSIEGGSVTISKNNQKALQSVITSNGRFRLELDYNADYTLTFNQKGFLAKSVIVNTCVPDDVLSRPTNFPRFLMAVKLYTDVQDPKNLFPGAEKQQIVYNPVGDEFMRKPTIYDNHQYVEKGNLDNSTADQELENKMRMLGYKVF
jgi:hypothetical protein